MCWLAVAMVVALVPIGIALAIMQQQQQQPLPPHAPPTQCAQRNTTASMQVAMPKAWCKPVAAQEGERALFHLDARRASVARISVSRGEAEHADITLFRTTARGVAVPLSVRGTSITHRLLATASGFALDSVTPSDSGVYLVVVTSTSGGAARACFKLTVTPAAKLPLMHVVIVGANNSDCVALVTCVVQEANSVLGIAGDAHNMLSVARSSKGGSARVDGVLLARANTAGSRISCVNANARDVAETSAFLLRTDCSYRILRRGFTPVTQQLVPRLRGRVDGTCGCCGKTTECADVRVTRRLDAASVSATLVVTPSAATLAVAVVVNVAVLVVVTRVLLRKSRARGNLVVYVGDTPARAAQK